MRCLRMPLSRRETLVSWRAASRRAQRATSSSRVRGTLRRAVFMTHSQCNANFVYSCATEDAPNPPALFLGSSARDTNQIRFPVEAWVFPCPKRKASSDRGKIRIRVTDWYDNDACAGSAGTPASPRILYGRRLRRDVRWGQGNSPALPGAVP